jgi:hypothetical protein
MGSCRQYPPLILLVLGCATSGVADDPPAVEPGEPAYRDALPGRDDHLEIELDHPVSDQHIRHPLPVVEVRGRAGTLPFFASDVVLLIDHSTLAAVASGIDVDGDGVVGRNRSAVTQFDPLAPHAPLWTTDSGDTLHELQMKIARALVTRLAARQNRVGLTSFTFRAWTSGTSVVRLTEKPPVDVPVGEPEAALAALENFPRPRERRWTDLTRLLEHGAELLDDATSPTEPFRSRALLLLSLGAPSAPSGIGWSSKSAVEYAGELSKRDIALWAISLRSTDTAFLSELTQSSTGSVLLLDQLDAQFGAPVPRDLRPRELEIENVTKRAQTTHLRVFPDGRFEAVVPVEPGANTLEIRAVLADGHRETIRRLVHYEVVPAGQTP